jgi:hypothetical protein
MKKLSALFLLLVSLDICSALGLGLCWIPSISTNVTGYKIYYGVTSGIYTNTIDVGNVTNCSVNNLDDSTTYYFAATAYAPDTLSTNSVVESAFSNETQWPLTQLSPPGFLFLKMDHR